MAFQNKWYVLDVNEKRIGVVTAFDKQRATERARELIPDQGFYLERMSEDEIKALSSEQMGSDYLL